jgi:hypothetical protein
MNGQAQRLHEVFSVFKVDGGEQRRSLALA